MEIIHTPAATWMQTHLQKALNKNIIQDSFILNANSGVWVGQSVRVKGVSPGTAESSHGDQGAWQLTYL